MKQRSYIFIFNTCIFLLSVAYGRLLEGVDNKALKSQQQTIHEDLFVSLGSYCGPAHTLRACELRQAAFPFDWITSLDSEGFLKILEDDFSLFLNENHLSVVELGVLLNTHYHLEFIHDGDFREQLTMEAFQKKYQKRIKRFQNLGSHRFPDLDFTLIVVNSGEGNDVYEEKRLMPNLIKLRSNPAQEAAVIWSNYKKYFSFLTKKSL